MSFQAKVNEYNQVRYWTNNPVIEDAARKLRVYEGNGANR